ncbi:hypothetical protein KA005_07465 [bacterium]|nr:hypothetical protein [bacterium]
MIEKKIGSGGACLTPEFDDVMNATDLFQFHSGLIKRVKKFLSTDLA